MADANNPSVVPPVEDSSQGGQPTDQGGGGSSNQSVDPAEQARRDQQSKKDKANSENDELRETVDFLSQREAERARDQHVSEFLTSNSDKYPDVKPDDPMFKYATSKEDVEEIATTLQNKYKDMQQNALKSVQFESDNGLTDEEIAANLANLEKETKETGKSTFGSYLDNITRRRK